MKIIFISFLVVLGFNSCSNHVSQDDGYYERANKASEKAHKEFH